MEGSVIFGAPSWLNHAFDANVVVTTICDVVVLRASRDIPEGEELTRSYTTWTWDLPMLTDRLSRFGITLESCVRDSQRLLPPAGLQHTRWQALCRLLASVENEIKCGSREGRADRLSGCDGALSKATADWASVLEDSDYLRMRLRMLEAEVRLYRGRMLEARDALASGVSLLRACDAPAGEFARFCTIALLIAAGLAHDPSVINGRDAAAELAEVAASLAAAFLGPSLGAFRGWVHCWFGHAGPMSAVLALLPAQVAPLEAPGVAVAAELASELAEGVCDWATSATSLDAMD